MGIAAVSMFMASFSTNNVGGLVFLQGILFGLSGSLIYLVRFLRLHTSSLAMVLRLIFRRHTLRPVTGSRNEEGSAQALLRVEVD